VDLLEAVARHAAERPRQIAHRWRDEAMTYSELAARSDALASYLVDQLNDDRTPVVVHGHKQPAMLVCFLACVKAGHPYIPVDISLPEHRVQEIIEGSEAKLVLAVEDVAVPDGTRRMNSDEIEVACRSGAEPPEAGRSVATDETYYIIYTSGSTGTPKGVQVSRASLNAFARWALSLRHARGVSCGDPSCAVYLDHAPFSFDLSVFEMAMALASGATLFSIDRAQAAKLGDLFREFARSGLTVWVSTPSFADLCLADEGFRDGLLPELELFIFCGETLNHATARKLRDRFPRAAVMNTYGPTESTVAVTSVVCDDDVLANHRVLPVGAVKLGSRILIRDEQGNDLPPGSRGEIVIVGDTVSLGYYLQPDLTEQVFLLVEGPNGPERAYRTGDSGRIEDGMLHFLGRVDFQVKLHGYRIEIEDIEANLRRLPEVQRAVVAAVERPGAPGTVLHLHATVQLGGPVPENPLRTTLRLKNQLRRLLPDYMVPKVFAYVTEIPLTANGKVDRNKLMAIL
jgi:D-alanine--poly(phosphoribitol) ligase subunit 1